MKKIIATAVLASAFALSACGSSTDASEDATADTVEMPADDAMAGAPAPVADEAAAETEMQANEADAEAAATEAQATVDEGVEGAIDDAEANMQ